MKKMPILLTSCLLAACSVSQQKEKLSWHEEQIISLGYEEKNIDLSMEEIFEKQKVCEDYANENVGTQKYDDEWQELHAHRYSQRFDRCFSMRTNTFDERGIQYLIFDALSGDVLFNSMSWCKDSYKNSGRTYTYEDMKKLCIEYSDLDIIWGSLIERPK